MDALQITMASLVRRVAIAEVAAQRHTNMAVSIDGQFDELRDIIRGLQGNRGGVVDGPPSVGPISVPHLGTAVADVSDPRLDPVLPYHFQSRPGTDMAQGNQVLPGSHLRGPVG
jgi:hypothetical protein